jgi:hypothetical protein
MVNFKIQFGYNKILYTAIVHRIPPADRFPLQYLISDISPEIQNTSPVFVYYPEKEIFDFSNHNGSVNLAEKIIKAIKHYCLENEIALV